MDSLLSYTVKNSHNNKLVLCVTVIEQQLRKIQKQFFQFIGLTTEIKSESLRLWIKTPSALNWLSNRLFFLQFEIFVF